MKRVREIGARQGDGEREPERRQIELIHRYDDERPSFGLFRATGRIRISPDNITLMKRLAQYSGSRASKPRSSSVSAR